MANMVATWLPAASVSWPRVESVSMPGDRRVREGEVEHSGARWTVVALTTLVGREEALGSPHESSALC